MSDDDRDEDDVASQRMMAVGELGASIVHEVRNVVTSIRGFAQVGLRKDGLTDDLREALQTIERESARCAATLSGFLGFARAQQAEHVATHLNDVVTGAVGLVKHQLALGRVQIEVDLADDVPAVTGDPGALSQVIVNLALNAQHAMPDGGRVSISTRAAEGAAEVVVDDEGPGIAPELRDRIFEPFFTTRANGQGTGLGLAISARIAVQHGGSLRAEAGDTGARFVLRIPARED